MGDRDRTWSWRYFLGRVGVFLLLVIVVEAGIVLVANIAGLWSTDEYGFCTTVVADDSDPFECREEVSASIIMLGPVALLFASTVVGALSRSTQPLRVGAWCLCLPFFLALATYLNGTSTVAFVAIMAVPFVAGASYLLLRQNRQ